MKIEEDDFEFQDLAVAFTLLRIVNEEIKAKARNKPCRVHTWHKGYRRGYVDVQEQSPVGPQDVWGRQAYHIPVCTVDLGYQICINCKPLPIRSRRYEGTTWVIRGDILPSYVPDIHVVYPRATSLSWTRLGTNYLAYLATYINPRHSIPCHRRASLLVLTVLALRSTPNPCTIYKPHTPSCRRVVKLEGIL